VEAIKQVAGSALKAERASSA